ncbi:ATP-dependent DNA helicase PIF1, partial [Phenoliferia sp. Uapishka_3]
MAACNIGGLTIHSFAGIGLGKESPEVLIANVRKNKKAAGRWQRTQVLVVDEISMIDGILFDKIAAIAQAMKKRPGVPFGGIQLVVTGDFFQLPPVAKGMATFAFEAKSWNNTINHVINLTQVFRQKSTEFIDMLNEMRFGELSQSSITKFRNLSHDRTYPDGVEPTELFVPSPPRAFLITDSLKSSSFPRREDVERSNEARLKALPGEPVTYKADDWTESTPGQYGNTYLQNFMAPEKLVLKIGAQVMLIKVRLSPSSPLRASLSHFITLPFPLPLPLVIFVLVPRTNASVFTSQNLDPILVNGTIGIVVAFGISEVDDDGFEVKEEDESEYQVKKKLKTAAAVGAGQLELAPVIEWRTPTGVERKPLAREEFKVENPKGERLASRKQFPMILAWAMSIHKSQGQTLPRVKVDLRKVFEKDGAPPQQSYGGQQQYGAPPPGQYGAPPPGQYPPPGQQGGYGQQNQGYGAPPQQRGQEGPDQLRMWFNSVDLDRSGAISQIELKQALVNGDWTPFSDETIKMLLAMFDVDRSGTIGFNEFSGLWQYIKEWQGIFRNFDRDRSGSIDANELGAALQSFGYPLPPQIVQTLEKKYIPNRSHTLPVGTLLPTFSTPQPQLTSSVAHRMYSTTQVEKITGALEIFARFDELLYEGGDTSKPSPEFAAQVKKNFG